jgi:lipoprotein signal peptidase
MGTNTDKIYISKKTVAFIILAVFFVGIDRFLKALCLNGFFDQPLPLVGDIFTLHYVKNYYIAFSLPFSGPILTGVIGVIILILLIFWLNLVIKNFKFQISNFQIYPLTILILGAILNFTDRIKYDYVIDYSDLKYFTVFNLADIMITVSVFYIILINLYKKNSLYYTL